jgi:predicted AAA+ superfamily ATPase
VDEVQKAPGLLDEVHWLHENRGIRFALAASSARKVRRSQANLLGGRALRYELFGLVSAELGSDWNLDRMLNHGTLPRVYLRPRPVSLLESYIADYLKEEVAAEALVRNLPAFSSFLDIASLSDTSIVNCAAIGRDCGVSAPTVREYFGILEDTLLATWLPSYRKKPKRRVQAAPKLYFRDVGVVGFLAKRGVLAPGSELYGKAFENWCHHELRAYSRYAERRAALSYWHPAGGMEVDFIVNDMELAIEAKAARKITSDHLRGLRSLREDHPEVRRSIVVCLESHARKTEDRIEILPVGSFCAALWHGELF